MTRWKARVCAACGKGARRHRRRGHEPETIFLARHATSCLRWQQLFGMARRCVTARHDLNRRCRGRLRQSVAAGEGLHVRRIEGACCNGGEVGAQSSVAGSDVPIAPPAHASSPPPPLCHAPMCTHIPRGAPFVAYGTKCSHKGRPSDAAATRRRHAERAEALVGAFLGYATPLSLVWGLCFS